MQDETISDAVSGEETITDTLKKFTEEIISPNPSTAIASTTFYSSHAAFVDNFGAIFTILSCGIAGY